MQLGADTIICKLYILGWQQNNKYDIHRIWKYRHGLTNENIDIAEQT